MMKQALKEYIGSSYIIKQAKLESPYSIIFSEIPLETLSRYPYFELHMYRSYLSD